VGTAYEVEIDGRERKLVFVRQRTITAVPYGSQSSEEPRKPPSPPACERTR